MGEEGAPQLFIKGDTDGSYTEYMVAGVSVHCIWQWPQKK